MARRVTSSSTVAGFLFRGAELEGRRRRDSSRRRESNRRRLDTRATESRCGTCKAGTVVEKYAADFAIDVIRFQGNLLVTQFFGNNVAVLGPAAPTPLVEGIQTPPGLAARETTCSSLR